MVKILKKSDSTHSSSKGAVNAYFLTGSFFKKTVVFEAAIFVGQSEDGAEVRCEVSRRVETAVSRYGCADCWYRENPVLSTDRNRASTQLPNGEENGL